MAEVLLGLAALLLAATLFLALPVFMIFVSWRRWTRAKQGGKSLGWRRNLVREVLIGVSANYVIFYAFFICSLIRRSSGNVPETCRLGFIFAIITLPSLIIMAFIAKGPPKFLAAGSAFLCLFLWLWLALGMGV